MILGYLQIWYTAKLFTQLSQSNIGKYEGEKGYSDYGVAKIQLIQPTLLFFWQVKTQNLLLEHIIPVSGVICSNLLQFLDNST